MKIERTNEEIIIRLPATIEIAGLQRLVDYLSYVEATQHSEAAQEDIDKLAREVKVGWWKKNSERFIK